MGNYINSPWVSWLANFCAIGMLCWFAYDIYQRGFWKTTASATTTQEQAPTPAVRPKNIDVNRIVSAHLFGQQIKAAPVIEVVEAPKTRLKLKLIGVIAGDENTVSRAIIQATGNKQSVVKIGEAIGKTNAKLHSVEAGRVLIDRNGALESLDMERANLAAIATAFSRQIDRGSSIGIQGNADLPEPSPTQPSAEAEIELLSPEELQEAYEEEEYDEEYEEAFDDEEYDEEYEEISGQQNQLSLPVDEPASPQTAKKKPNFTNPF